MTNGWNYKLSTKVDSTSVHVNKRKLHDEEIPPFTPETFLEHLVHFIVADDQVGLNFSYSFKLTDHIHLFSRYTSLNVLSSDAYVWSFGRLLSTLTFLAMIKWEKLSSINGGCCLTS